MFLSKKTVNSTTSVNEIADFIEPLDKIPVLMAVGAYQYPPPNNIQGYKLVYTHTRFLIYKKFINGAWYEIIACRGTKPTLDITKQFHKDIVDDVVIAGFGGVTCNISLVHEVNNIIKNHFPVGNYTNLTFTGHSLGGYAAMCLAMRFPGARAISLFGGAPPTKPLTIGPGPGLCTHYHILGDMVSGWCTPTAAKCIRIQKIGWDTWGFSYAHMSDRIWKNDDRGWVYITPDEENISWQNYCESLGPLGKKYATPIPGSTNTMLIDNSSVPEDYWENQQQEWVKEKYDYQQIQDVMNEHIRKLEEAKKQGWNPDKVVFK